MRGRGQSMSGVGAGAGLSSLHQAGLLALGAPGVWGLAECGLNADARVFTWWPASSCSMVRICRRGNWESGKCSGTYRPLASASCSMGLVGGCSVMNNPNCACSRSSTPFRSRICAAFTCPLLTCNDDAFGFAAVVVEEIDVAVDAGVGARRLSLAGRASTRPSAHHSNW